MGVPMGKGGKHNLTKTAGFNAASSVFNEVIHLAVVFVINPILLSWLGSSVFGIWKVCQRLLTYVSAADGRAVQALKWTIANRQHLDDVDAKRRDVGCALVVWLRFLPLVLVAGGLLVWFSPHFIKGLPPEYYAVTRFACGILVVNLILSPLRTIPEAVLIGMNLGYRCRWVHAIGSVAGGFFMVTAVYLGWGLVGLAAASLAASLAIGTIILLVAKRSLPWLQVNKPQKHEIGRFFGFSIWVFAWTFINKLMLSGDIVILGLVSSAGMVTAYVLTFYAMQIATSFSSLLVSAAIPGLGGIVGKGDLVKAGDVRGEIISLSWLLATVVGAMILMWNFSFIKLWVGPENFVGFTENLILVIMMTQLIFIRVDAQIVDVTLNIKKKVLLGSVSTLLALALAFWLGSSLESPVLGCSLGLIAGRLMLTFSYPILVGKAFGNSARWYPLSIIRPIFALLVIYSTAAALGPHLDIDTWRELLCYGAVSLLLVGTVAFFMGLPKPVRDKVVVRIGQVSLSSRSQLKIKKRSLENIN